VKAPVGRRIAAFLADTAFSAAFFAVFLAAGYFLMHSSLSVYSAMAGFLLILVGLTLSASYILLRDCLFGGMGAGKRLVRLRVVKRDGSRCDAVSSALRNVTLLVPAVNAVELVWAVVDPEGRRLGDRIGGTQVVE
jgi:uncharacterized RDD family membrane protein YckC